MTFRVIQPNTYIVLRLPSETLKVLQIVPNTTISIGKYGMFPANCLLGRPYNHTFEIVEPSEDRKHPSLRVVPASELRAEGFEKDIPIPDELGDGKIIDDDDGLEDGIVDPIGDAPMPTNRDTIDDPARQKLSMEEIEELKKEGAGAGRDLISRLMLSHSGLAEKTAFSLAKYTLRKSRKFMRRFTVLPLDVAMLARWLLTEKESIKILETREEVLGLMGSLANIRWSSGEDQSAPDEGTPSRGCGRWLVVDDTGGLVVAALAERMGILYSPDDDDNEDGMGAGAATHANKESSTDVPRMDGPEGQPTSHARSTRPRRRRIPAMSAASNTITLLHANSQPNLSLLRYFLFDTGNPSPDHPLYTHLKTLSWLQLISPEEDTGYAEPELVSDEILDAWKGGKRANYFRKRRRWERIKQVADEARAGAFDGLVVASATDTITILQHVLGLLRGGAPVVIYSPYLEPLTELADVYSTTRRTAFLSDPPDPAMLPTEDFPLDPTLLLAPTIHTVTVQQWQCLPGRTHPVMSARGGAEGYLFTATRVFPAEGKVEARGKFKRRKVRKEETEEAQKDAPKEDVNGLDGDSPGGLELAGAVPA